MDERNAARQTLAAWIRRQGAARALSGRTLLGGIGGLGGLTLLGCSSGSDGSSAINGGGTAGSTATLSPATTAATTTTTTSSSTGSCVLIPQETVGPYPLFNDIASAAAYQRDDISGPRDAHSLPCVSRARSASDVAARVPGFGDERGVLEPALRREGPEPDDAYEGRHLFRRPHVPNADRDAERDDGWLRRRANGGHRGVAAAPRSRTWEVGEAIGD